MRYPAWLAAACVLGACSSSGSSHSAKLTLNDPAWDRINVQAVITTNPNCDSRSQGYVRTEEFTMTKGHSREIVAPNAEMICWRHDANPDSPSPGNWSGWSKATLFPGQTAETDL